MTPSSHFAGPLVVCDQPRGLEIVRGQGFARGAQEAPDGAGAAQMRLPLGEWIVGLREATTAAPRGRRGEPDEGTRRGGPSIIPLPTP